VIIRLIKQLIFLFIKINSKNQYLVISVVTLQVLLINRQVLQEQKRKRHQLKLINYKNKIVQYFFMKIRKINLNHQINQIHQRV
jgi:hypothetical protein